jgi:5-methylcytosine-specific restriction endonuclease McrA
MGQHSKLYNSQTWRKMRAYQLARFPLCAYCQSLGHVKTASVADHIKPHRGNLDLFYDPKNLQSLCQSCHNAAKKIEEGKGQTLGHGFDGLPIGKDW